MSEKKHNTPTGYLAVATAARILNRSRQWIYDLIDDGKLKTEEHILPGTGLTPVKVVTLESFMEYVRNAEQYEGQRIRILNQARGEATKTRVIEFTEVELDDIKKRYLEDNEGLEPIALVYHTSSETIKRLLGEMGVDLKPGKLRYQEEREKFVETLEPQIREQIRQKFLDGLGPQRIAIEIGWGHGRAGKVRRVLDGMGIPRRNRSEARKLRVPKAAA